MQAHLCFSAGRVESISQPLSDHKRSIHCREWPTRSPSYSRMIGTAYLEKYLLFLTLPSGTRLENKPQHLLFMLNNILLSLYSLVGPFFSFLSKLFPSWEFLFPASVLVAGDSKQWENPPSHPYKVVSFSSIIFYVPLLTSPTSNFLPIPAHSLFLL